jgi:glycosyltransferase involved in cell wall biosynthesis
MSKLQVLVFIDWYLPGFKAGGPVRSLANLVDHLRDRIDFHIVTTDTDYTEHKPYPNVVPDQWTTLPGSERVWYASRSGVNAETWKRLLSEKQWDTVYINGLYSRWFSIRPLMLLKGSKQRRVVAVRGMLAHGMMKHGALKKRAFLFTMRMLGAYKNVVFQATNAEEVEDVKKWIASDAEVHLVPNLARKLTTAWPAQRSKNAGELRLVSVARIAKEKNTLFAIERLRHATGSLTLDLFGPIYDEVYWSACQKAIAALPPNVRVVHRGTVGPNDVGTLFTGYHALFMPSEGENFGHTMIEALVMGLPLLISDRTPWRKLHEVNAGWDLPLEDPGAFESKIEDLLGMDQTGFIGLSTGAFELGRRYLADPAPIERSFSLLCP